MSIHSGKVGRHFGYGIRVPFTARKISGNEVRVPDPVPGEATVISRYGKERAIVIHPSDFNRLNQIEALLTAAAALEPIALSEDAIRAHAEEGAPGEPITDPAVLAELFG
jgi:PHD/YefM family antitoxin component YafN of YafNO toxin-antitoxin module